VGIACISFAAIFVRLALPASPVITGFYRMLFASFLLLPFVLVQQRSRGRASPLPVATAAARRRSIALALLAGACFGTDLALWHTGIVETSVANATLLLNTTPVYVGLFASLVLGQRLGRSFFAGAGLALCGSALLVGIEVGEARALRGDLLSLVAALFYSGYLLLMKSSRMGLDAAYAVLLSSASATLVLGLYAAGLGHPFWGFPAHSWLAMLGAAAITQVGGVLAIAWALRYLRTTFASVGLLGQPIGAAALGWLVLGESVEPVQALGGAAVLAGIFIASREAQG
jgi:drug/metabolite transporter (DMT)-like permease